MLDVCRHDDLCTRLTTLSDRKRATSDEALTYWLQMTYCGVGSMSESVRTLRFFHEMLGISTSKDGLLVSCRGHVRYALSVCHKLIEAYLHPIGVVELHYRMYCRIHTEYIFRRRVASPARR